MNLIALDSGQTTGCAVINERGEILFSSNIDFTRIKEELADLDKWFWPDHVVAERAPAFGVSKLGNILNSVQDAIRAQFPQATWVRSAEWLGSPARNFEVPKTWNSKRLSPHQKDSIRMAKWYLKFRLEKLHGTASKGERS